MNIGQLKAQLSKVVRQLQAGGDPVEVCVREAPVAYLTSIRKPGAADSPERDWQRLGEQLSGVGLTLRTRPVIADTPYRPQAHRAGDGKTDISTVQALRAEKPW